MPSSADDMLGLGGEFTAYSGTSNRVLKYHASSAGYKVLNVSPVSLRVNFVFIVPQAYKKLTGRPKLLLYNSSTAKILRMKTENEYTHLVGEPNKGLLLMLSIELPPTANFRVSHENINFDREMLPNVVSLMATDDYGGVPDVSAPPSVLPRDDGEEELATSAISLRDVVATWGGRFFRMGYSENVGQFPNGIVYSERQTAQGTRGYISNVTDQQWCVNVSAFIGGYAGGFYVAGTTDGGPLSAGGNTRTGIWLDLPPHGEAAFEPTTPDTYDVYMVMSFSPRPFSERFNRL